MPIVEHKFRSHQVDLNTETLILGTFHPDIDNGADFFYGRKRNYLWRLLPMCFGDRDLRASNNLQAKKKFMDRRRVDFCDLIRSVDVPPTQIKNYSDNYIDGKINDSWNDTTALIDSLKNLKAVYFTRKTFQGIPKIKARIRQVKDHCEIRGLRFCVLPTPARFANETKLNSWRDIIVNGAPCDLDQFS